MDQNEMINLFEQEIQEFVDHNRPPEHIRHQLDWDYTFDKYTFELLEVRPNWRDKTIKMKIPVAKARFIKSRNLWKIYWMRASGKWEAYPPEPEVDHLFEVLKIIKDDELGCFWG